MYLYIHTLSTISTLLSTATKWSSSKTGFTGSSSKALFSASPETGINVLIAIYCTHRNDKFMCIFYFLFLTLFNCILTHFCFQKTRPWFDSKNDPMLLNWFRIQQRFTQQLKLLNVLGTFLLTNLSNLPTNADWIYRTFM